MQPILISKNFSYIAFMCNTQTVSTQIYDKTSTLYMCSVKICLRLVFIKNMSHFIKYVTIKRRVSACGCFPPLPHPPHPLHLTIN